MAKLSSLVNKKGWMFASGIVAGLILPSIAKSQTARKVAVNATAKGMKIKDDTVTCGKSIKEEAEDVYAEAKQKNASAAE